MAARTEREPAVSRIVAGLVVRREELAHAMAEAVLEEVAEVAPLAATPVRDEGLAHASDDFDAFLAAVDRGHAPAGAELAFVRAQGAKRAREHVPLDALLHAH